jgi:hypothetical protein
MPINQQVRFRLFGAGNEARTRDLNLGKVALYQLSYSRVKTASIIAVFGARSRLKRLFIFIMT